MFTPQTRLFAEVSAGHTRTARRFSPSPSFVELPAGSAANPYGLPVGVFFRLLDAGARQLEATVDSARLVAGAGGSWRDWAWEVSGGVNRIKTDFRVTNSLRRSRLNAAVGAGRFSPFIAVQDPELIEQLRADTRDRFCAGIGATARTQNRAGHEFCRRVRDLRLRGRRCARCRGTQFGRAPARAMPAIYDHRSHRRG